VPLASRQRTGKTPVVPCAHGPRTSKRIVEWIVSLGTLRTRAKMQTASGDYRANAVNPAQCAPSCWWVAKPAVRVVRISP